MNLNCEDVVVVRLWEWYGWVDDWLLWDVLQVVGGDEDVVCGQLDVMVEFLLFLFEGLGGKFDVVGDGLCFVGVVECEKNDVYLKNWREVLWMSW